MATPSHPTWFGSPRSSQTLGFQRTTWNFFAASHGKGAPGGIGGTLKGTADSLVLQGNDIVDGKTFHEMVGRSLSSIQLYHITEPDMQIYVELLSQSLKLAPTTKKIHQIPPYRNGINCRSRSYFCCDPQMCQCFSPTIFQLTENTHARVQAEEMYGPSTMGKA